MPNFLIGLFLGIILGGLIQHYLLPYFDILFEIFTAKSSEIINEHNLNIQEMSCLFLRSYPELDGKNNIQDQTNVIGFRCPTSDDEEYYEEDE